MRKKKHLLERVGDFCFRFSEDGKRSLILLIPRDRHGTYIESSWSIDHKNECGALWTWDGNESAPTLKPSLHAVGIWHGYVRAGMLIEA